jgi:hypothetical protein
MYPRKEPSVLGREVHKWGADLVSDGRSCTVRKASSGTKIRHMDMADDESLGAARVLKSVQLPGANSMSRII